MAVSQQPMPEHVAVPLRGVVLTTGSIQVSLMEQKDEQPVMMLPLSPSSVPCRAGKKKKAR